MVLLLTSCLSPIIFDQDLCTRGVEAFAKKLQPTWLETRHIMVEGLWGVERK